MSLDDQVRLIEILALEVNERRRIIGGGVVAASFPSKRTPVRHKTAKRLRGARNPLGSAEHPSHRACQHVAAVQVSRERLIEVRCDIHDVHSVNDPPRYYRIGVRDFRQTQGCPCLVDCLFEARGFGLP